MKRIAALFVLVLTLAGCSTPKASPTNSPSPTETKTEAQILDEFLKIAEDSCAKAQTENIVETVADGSKIIVLAKDNAYKDYSAVYIDPQGKTQVIYEMELSVCAPGYLISMMEEAGKKNEGDYEHGVKLNDDGTYTWKQKSFYEGESFEETKYTVVDGIITAAKTSAYDYSFAYGAVAEADMNVFKKAIDDEIERLSE